MTPYGAVLEITDKKKIRSTQMPSLVFKFLSELPFNRMLRSSVWPNL